MLGHNVNLTGTLTAFLVLGPVEETDTEQLPS